VTDQSQFVAHQYRKREFQELDGKASETVSKIDISVEKLLKAKRLSTLKWLSDTPLKDIQQQQGLWKMAARIKWIHGLAHGIPFVRVATWCFGLWEI
jgi:hypothetical protein